MRRIDAPVYGMRSITPVTALVDRCAVLLRRLGDHAFVCGPTAALLWGAPLDLCWETRTTIDVAVEAPARAPHAAGLAGRSLRLGAGDVLAGRSGRLTSPARTWCDLGALLPLADLVAVGDFLLHARLVEAPALAAAVERYPGRRGLRAQNAALALLDGRAESRPESLVRVGLVRAGIAGVEPNVVIRDRAGGFVARVDLCIAWARVVIEYHGDYHRVEKGRWRRDRTRMSRLRAAGWHVIELTADDLADLPGVIALVQEALRR
ncbi:DUF559 domain-containing protein [Rathayibacter sp. VKM Ac-2801]|uniref:endonuclease domain-containing protein n=1 Tax=Rathayibacter sp. VKM Ac-2801 TaxID=2609255 RepID=UPI00131F8C54|nr:DUF559 domain-containing protein [Rathayibacter sp. VKM Ac-2801]QHC71186.1 DUF559 domain-containing protein [Rathayibacter sp. VKM Ac-2801]